MGVLGKKGKIFFSEYGSFKCHIWCIKVSDSPIVTCQLLSHWRSREFCLADEMSMKEDKRFMQITFRCERALKKETRYKQITKLLTSDENTKAMATALYNWSILSHPCPLSHGCHFKKVNQTILVFFRMPLYHDIWFKIKKSVIDQVDCCISVPQQIVCVCSNMVRVLVVLKMAMKGFVFYTKVICLTNQPMFSCKNRQKLYYW